MNNIQHIKDYLSAKTNKYLDSLFVKKPFVNIKLISLYWYILLVFIVAVLIIIECDLSPIDVFVFKNWLTASMVNNILRGILYGLFTGIVVYLTTAYIPEKKKKLQIEKSLAIHYFITFKKNYFYGVTSNLVVLNTSIQNMDDVLSNDDCYNDAAVLNCQKYINSMLVQCIECVKDSWFLFESQISAIPNAYIESGIKQYVASYRLEQYVCEIIQLKSSICSPVFDGSKADKECLRYNLSAEQVIYRHLDKVKQLLDDIGLIIASLNKSNRYGL